MTQPREGVDDLWELLSAKLRGFFARRVTDAQVVDDLLQETFLRIHAKLSAGGASAEPEDDQRLHAWVFQVARNLLIDHRRLAKHHDALGIDTEEAPSAAGGGRDAGSANLNELVGGWLPAMVARLPETYRRAIELYEFEGRSQQEIADLLGLSLSGAKSRVQRGRERLRSLLLDCCSFERDVRGNVIDYRPNAPGGCSEC